MTTTIAWLERRLARPQKASHPTATGRKHNTTKIIAAAASMCHYTKDATRGAQVAMQTFDGNTITPQHQQPQHTCKCENTHTRTSTTYTQPFKFAHKILDNTTPTSLATWHTQITGDGRQQHSTISQPPTDHTLAPPSNRHHTTLRQHPHNTTRGGAGAPPTTLHYAGCRPDASSPEAVTSAGWACPHTRTETRTTSTRYVLHSTVQLVSSTNSLPGHRGCYLRGPPVTSLRWTAAS